MSDFEKEDMEERPGDKDLETALKDFPDIAKAIDRRVTKAISTFKDRHNISEDNKDLKPLKADELAQREATIELKESAILQAVQKGVSPALAVKMVGRDKEETNKNLNELFAEISKGYEKAGREFISKNNYMPLSGTPGIEIDMSRIDKPGVYSEYVRRYGMKTVEAFITNYQGGKNRV